MVTKHRPPSPMIDSVSEIVEDLPDTFLTAESRFSHTIELDVDRIDRNLEQPRKAFADGEIEGLARTMAAEGQLQPIVVRRNPDAKGRWIVVAGERRWRAAKFLGWPKILVIEHEGDAEVASLLENLQRVDLNVVEEARGLQRLIQARGWTQVRAAEVLGKRLSDLNGALGVLSLPTDFLEEFLKSEISVSRNALIELARVEEEQARTYLIEQARAGRLTISAIRAAREQEEHRGKRKKLGRSTHLTSRLPGRLSLKSIRKLRTSIQSIRQVGRIADPREREELLELMLEIREWLG